MAGKRAEAHHRRSDKFRVVVGPEWVNGWLAFETPGERRRLANYPPDWIEMPDADLEKLCETALVATPRRRLIE